jgi:hypothetical protein
MVKSQITTAQLEALTRIINRVYAHRQHCCPQEGLRWRKLRDERMKQLHSFRKFSAREQAARPVLDLVVDLFETDIAWMMNDRSQFQSSKTRFTAQQLPPIEESVSALRLQELEDLWANECTRAAELAAQVDRLEDQIAVLEHQVVEARAQLQQQPQIRSLVIPQQLVHIRSDLQMEIIHLIGRTGLARQWRIVNQLLSTDLTANANSVRNSLRDLRSKHGLLTYYTERNKPVYWAFRSSGGSPLLQLTDTGKAFYKQAYGTEPVTSEVLTAVQQHKSAVHGIGILEARDYLRAAGYTVEDEPIALLLDEQARWGQRAEPDLTLTMDGETWPVEVQREVSERLLEKWEKTLQLVSHLVLILFNEEKRQQQQQILQTYQRARRLPEGKIKLSSLEAFASNSWEWHTLFIVHR